MNTRRHMRAKFLLRASRKYIANHPIRHMVICDALSMEFLYTKNANREMRKTNHFGLPNKKEFEKLISNQRLIKIL